MKESDYFGLAMTLGFGLWLVVLPKSVIGFYTWFHRGRVKMPGTIGVRLAGALWIVLVFIVMAVIFAKR